MTLEKAFVKAIEIVKQMKAERIRVVVWMNGDYKIEPADCNCVIKIKNYTSVLEVEGKKEAVLSVLSKYEELYIWKCWNESGVVDLCKAVNELEVML